MDLRLNKVRKQLREHLLELTEERLIKSTDGLFTDITMSRISDDEIFKTSVKGLKNKKIKKLVDSIRYSWYWAYMYNENSDEKYFPWSNHNHQRGIYTPKDFTYISVDVVVGISFPDANMQWHQMKEYYTFRINWKEYVRNEKLKLLLEK